mmetsp:Transcript_17970/g.51117  ORF Transcript_17970/g.51117 Transcript_17970/m.51117 type:complete len:108 (-) Transcript_17970:42-365(-)
MMGGGPMQTPGGPMQTPVISILRFEFVPSTGPFQFQLFQRPSRWEISGCVRNISAEKLAQQGEGEARLKDIEMTMTLRHFPMRALALHYLRLCAKEGRWDGVTHMAK